ncbi:MAG: peptidoglycan-associated lipoprotein Pal, partial [Candidatus Methylomirabilia bacterium]
ASAAPGIGAVEGAGTVQGTGTPQGTATSRETMTSQRTDTALGAGAAKPATPLAAARVTPGAATTSGAPAPTPEEFTPSRVLRDIYFGFDKYDIRPAAARILDGHSEWLRDNYGSVILIEGHADERGTNEYNLALGDRRAKAAMDYLIARGVAAGQINVITYGEERPLCVEVTEACWSQNRRAHFLVKRQ